MNGIAVESSHHTLLQLFHEFTKVRQQLGEEGVLTVLQHHLTKQLESHGQGGGGAVIDVRPLAQSGHDGKDVVVVASFELQGRRIRGGIAMLVSQMLNGNAVLVLFHFLFHSSSIQEKGRQSSDLNLAGQVCRKIGGIVKVTAAGQYILKRTEQRE